MNLEALKIDFQTYLEEKGKISEEEAANLSKGFSVFQYINEFKEFIAAQTGKNTEIKAQTISDLLALSFTEGQFEDDEAKTMGSDDGQNKENALTQLFNDLLKNKDFKEKIDLDKSGEITNEEMSKFLDTIKGLDGDEENISADDLIDAAIKINNNEFESQEIIPEQETAPVETPQTTEASQSQNGGNSGGVSGNNGGGAVTPANNYDTVQKKTLDKMSAEELKTELSSANSTLKDKQENLDKIMGDSDPAISSLKEKKEEAFEKYMEALKEYEPELADEIKTKQGAVDEAQKEVFESDKNIIDCTTKLSEAETNYDNAVSNKENLEGVLANLQSAKSEDKDYSSEIAAVQQMITQAEEQIKTTEEAKEKAKQALDDAKKTKTEKEKALDERKTELSDVEAKLSDSPAKELQSEYKKAEDSYNTTKTSQIQSAKTGIVEAQNYVNEVNKAIQTNTNNATAKQYNPKASGDEIIEFAQKFLGKSASEMRQIMRSAGYQFDNGAWCADFVSFCQGMVLGEENLPAWYRNTNRAYCPNLMRQSRQANAQINIQDAQPGDVVMLGIGGTGNEHAALFAGWADDQHNAYYTIERCGESVQRRKRTISSGDVGAMFRLYNT